MDYAYVTLLSTNEYYLGVVALFESIRNTITKYENFIVVVNEKIDEDIINKLKKRNYKIIKRNRINITKNIDNKKYDYWINTFDKFHIFELTEYKKIVYLDSDIYVDKNIDELFELQICQPLYQEKNIWLNGLK